MHMKKSMDNDTRYVRSEARFKEILTLMQKGSSDLWVELDLSLLEEVGVLVDFEEEVTFPPAPFELFVGEEKITLLSPDLLVWLLPLQEEGEKVTYAILASGLQESPRLYQTIRARGVYNTSKMLMRTIGKWKQFTLNP